MFNPIQMTFSFAVAVIVGTLLGSVGWPWYAAFPAAILSAFAAATLYVLVWALIRRLTYPHIARRQREYLRGRQLVRRPPPDRGENER